MNISATTEFDIGDSVYIAETYDVYVPDGPYNIIGIKLQIIDNATTVRYMLDNGDKLYGYPEHLCFDTYEECLKWCYEHNKNLDILNN